MSGFVKRVSEQIHNHKGEPFLLQGVGIGGWLLMEGYMIKSFDDIDRPRRIEAFITKQTDGDYCDYFMNEWRNRFFTKEDVIFIKNSGFNSIRIPFDYHVLFTHSTSNGMLIINEKGFDRLDAIIQHCEDVELYVILDLHGAPGGQTGTNIDNSKTDHPDLFTDEIHQQQTIEVWQTIAKRYKDKFIIAAYDLLNEPLPEWHSQYNNQLVPLYKRMINAIREVDPNHMITVEGWHWSTDLSCFTALIDENILLQFHKYWSSPDQESIQPYLDLRQKLHAPLFMGEGGENNHKWYSAVFKLYEQKDISYNFWTYKKMDNTNSLKSFAMPDKWREFLRGDLSTTEAKAVLNELLQHIQYSQTITNPLTVQHILRKKEYNLYAFVYDFFGKRKSFVSIGAKPSLIRQSDGICIQNKDKTLQSPNFKQYGGEDVPEADRLVVFLEKGEWVNYTFTGILNTLEMTIDVDPNTIEVFASNRDVYRVNRTYCCTGETTETTITIQAIQDVELDTFHIRQAI